MFVHDNDSTNNNEVLNHTTTYANRLGNNYESNNNNILFTSNVLDKENVIVIDDNFNMKKLFNKKELVRSKKKMVSNYWKEHEININVDSNTKEKDTEYIILTIMYVIARIF